MEWNRCLEFEGRWQEGVFGWEVEVTAKIASCEGNLGVRFLLDTMKVWEGGVGTAVVFAVVGDHEHHLPLEHVVIYQSARDSWQVFCLLHSFQLSRQEPGGSSGRGCRHFGFLHRSGVCIFRGRVCEVSVSADSRETKMMTSRRVY